MKTVKVAARLALNDIGEAMVTAIEAVDKGDLQKAMDACANAAHLLSRATELIIALDEIAGQPS